MEQGDDRMKKIITGIIVATMLTQTAAFAASFTDIKGHWAEDTIKTLADKGIVDGVTNTQFMPDGDVTRAQYLKMIMEATGMETTPYREGECLEVKAGTWYAPYVQKALDCGLIPESMIAGFKQSVEYTVDENGTATESKVVYSGAFNGDLTINREEMAVLTEYVYQYTRTVLTNDTVNVSKVKDFADNDRISDWAQTSIKLSVAHGFIEGTDNNMFAPKEKATRAQAATIIKRVIDKQEEIKK